MPIDDERACGTEYGRPCHRARYGIANLVSTKSLEQRREASDFEIVALNAVPRLCRNPRDQRPVNPVFSASSAPIIIGPPGRSGAGNGIAEDP